MSKNEQPTAHSWPVPGDPLPADPTASRSWPSANEDESHPQCPTCGHPDYCADDCCREHLRCITHGQRFELCEAESVHCLSCGKAWPEECDGYCGRCHVLH